MPLEKTDRSLNAANLVNKHRDANRKYGCQLIANLMKEHGVSLEDLANHLDLPTQDAALQVLRGKLFRGVKEVKGEVMDKLFKQEKDGVLGDKATNRSIESRAEAAGEAQARKTPTQARKTPAK